MFVLKSIEKVELKENFLVVNGKELNFGALTEDDKEVLNTMISKGAKYLPLLYLNNKYILESIDGKKLNKIEYLSYLLECKRIKKAGVKESNTKLRPLTNVGNLEILEGDNSICFGKEGKIFTEASNYEELRKYRMDNDDDLIVIRKNGEVIAKGMVDDLKDNWEDFEDFTFDEETKKYVCEYNGDTYTVEKIIVESADYPDRAAVDDPALNAEEEEELNSLYDREIESYTCKNCGKKIPNILDWDKKHYKEYGTEYYCPYCGEPYTYEEVESMAVFKEATDTEEPKEGFIVFQRGGMLGDSHDLEDKVFKTKEEAKAALKLWRDSYGRNKSYYKPEGSIYKYKGKTAKETREEHAKQSDLKEGAYPNFDLPEGYPQEVYDKYFEYTKDIDLTDDEPLDFNDWYKANGGDIKEVSPEELNAFLEAWENGDRESLDGQKLICFNGNEIIAVDNSDGYARIETFDKRDEGYARGWLNGKVDYEDFKLLKKRVNESVEDNFRDMVMELHSYVEADPKRISSDLKDAIKNNKLDDYLKSKAAMSDEEVKDFKERYLKESTVEEPRALVLDSYNHFMKDLGKTPTIDDIEEDILHAYSNAGEYFKGNESPEEYNRDLKYIQWVLRTENLDYAEDLEEGAGTQVGDIAPEEDYISPMVKVDTKKRKKKRIVKESAETYTDEEKAEYGLDDEGYDENGDLWIHCAWCGELVPVSECKKELNMGWICDNCQKALYSRGEKAHYEEGADYFEESLKEDSANITDIEYVEPNYTGGGVYVYTGKLKDGNYFLGGDDWFDSNNKMFTIRVVNENPDDYEEDCWFDDWQQEHLVRDLTEEENKEITKQILHWIIENKPDGNYDIRNMEDMLNIVEPDKLEEATEEIDEHLLDLLRMKERLVYDDSISDDIAYDMMERIDNELINDYKAEEIEKAKKLLGINESVLTEEHIVRDKIINGKKGWEYTTIDRECPMCHKKYVMFLNLEDSIDSIYDSEYSKVLKVEDGYGPIQNILYDFNPMEREFVKTGYCPSCQEKLFGTNYSSDIIMTSGEARSLIAQSKRNSAEREKAERQAKREEERKRRQPEIERKQKAREEREAKGITNYSLKGKKQDVLKALRDNLGEDYYIREPGIDGVLTIRKNDAKSGIRAYFQNKTLPDDKFGLVFEPVISNKIKNDMGAIYNMGEDYKVSIGVNDNGKPINYTGKAYKLEDIPKLVDEIKKVLNKSADIVEESLKVGDKISFYSNGYKTNGKWSNKRDIKMNTEVTNVLPNGAVSAKDPQGAKGFDYISPNEITEVNGELNPKLEYFAKVYYAHDNGDHDHKWTKKEIKDWVKDEIEMGNDMFNTDSDTLNMLYQFQHELYQEDKEEGLI